MEWIKKEFKINKEDILLHKKIHRGYAADAYIMKTKKGKYFIKKFKQKKGVNYPNFSLNRTFFGQLKATKMLSKIKNKNIITPDIIATNNEEKIIIQKYVKGESFYKFLLKNCNKFYFNKTLKNTFFELGRFLAEYHNKYFYKIKKKQPITQVHGDLCAHNLMFVSDNKLFIFDVSVTKGTIYVDLAKMFLNFYPLNFILNIFLSRKGLVKCKKKFFQGYKKNSKITLEKEILKEKILASLKIDKLYKTKKIIYLIKKFLANITNNTLMKKIKKDKIPLI